MTAQAPAPASPVERAPSDTRLVSLDVLRGVAILLVMAAHLPPLVAPETPFERALIAAAWRVGWSGVDLFFVLSGFLVAGLLVQAHQRTGRLDVQRFLIRRGFKIYPVFWVFLLVTSPMALAEPGVALTAVVRQLAFVQNYGPVLPALWGHTWSLAVEEHFYLVLPLALTVVCRRTGRLAGIVPVSLGVCLGALALRLRHWDGAFHLAYQHATHLRLDALAVGVLLAYGWHLHRPTFCRVLARHRGRVTLLALACLAPVACWPMVSPVMRTVGFTTTAIGYAALLALRLTRHAPPRRGADGLAWIGRHSYALYLWHLPVLIVTGTVWERLGWPAGFWLPLTVYAAGSILAGWGMTRLIERPALALRDRWFPR